MNSIIDAVFSRAHGCIDLLVFYSRHIGLPNDPKEAEPDIPIPIIYVSSTLDGIIPEDASVIGKAD